MSSGVKIVPACADDMDAILEIENLSFSSPWSREMFEDDLDNEFCRINVAKGDEDNKVCGYICFALVFEELSIMSLAVATERRRQKIATALLNDALEFAQGAGASVAFLEVRESHKGVQELYRKCGFQSAAVRKKYYSDNGEDALVMIKIIDKDKFSG